jgi:hypothetical protein
LLQTWLDTRLFPHHLLGALEQTVALATLPEPPIQAIASMPHQMPLGAPEPFVGPTTSVLTLPVNRNDVAPPEDFTYATKEQDRALSDVSTISRDGLLSVQNVNELLQFICSREPQSQPNSNNNNNSSSSNSNHNNFQVTPQQDARLEQLIRMQSSAANLSFPSPDPMVHSAQQQQLQFVQSLLAPRPNPQAQLALRTLLAQQQLVAQKARQLILPQQQQLQSVVWAEEATARENVQQANATTAATLDNGTFCFFSVCLFLNCFSFSFFCFVLFCFVFFFVLFFNLFFSLFRCLFVCFCFILFVCLFFS